MKLSIICYLSDDKKLNQTTVEALEKMASYSLEHDNQVTVAGKHVDKKYNNGKKDSVIASYEVEVILNTDRVQDDRSWYENVIYCHRHDMNCCYYQNRKSCIYK